MAVKLRKDAYARWLADSHVPALRKMDSEGAFEAAWAAAIEFCAGRLERAAGEYMASATNNKFLTDHGRALMTSAAEWAETQAAAFRGQLGGSGATGATSTPGALKLSTAPSMTASTTGGVEGGAIGPRTPARPSIPGPARAPRPARSLGGEAARLAFLEGRDGVEGARDFARRTLAAYRASLKRGKDGRRSGYGSVYRRALVESCLDFRQYLRPSGNESGSDS